MVKDEKTFTSGLGVVMGKKLHDGKHSQTAVLDLLGALLSQIGAAATTNANANTADANTNTANANSKSAERDANTNGEEKTRRVKRTYPRGQMMSSSDVKFVTDKVMTPLKFQDPYSQDFYYLQNGLKQNAKLREKAIKERYVS